MKDALCGNAYCSIQDLMPNSNYFNYMGAEIREPGDPEAKRPPWNWPVLWFESSLARVDFNTIQGAPGRGCVCVWDWGGWGLGDCCFLNGEREVEEGLKLEKGQGVNKGTGGAVCPGVSAST